MVDRLNGLCCVFDESSQQERFLFQFPLAEGIIFIPVFFYRMKNSLNAFCPIGYFPPNFLYPFEYKMIRIKKFNTTYDFIFTTMNVLTAATISSCTKFRRRSKAQSIRDLASETHIFVKDSSKDLCSTFLELLCSKKRSIDRCIDNTQRWDSQVTKSLRQSIASTHRIRGTETI